MQAVLKSPTIRELADRAMARWLAKRGSTDDEIALAQYERVKRIAYLATVTDEITLHEADLEALIP